MDDIDLQKIIVALEQVRQRLTAKFGSVAEADSCIRSQVSLLSSGLGRPRVGQVDATDRPDAIGAEEKETGTSSV